MTILLFFIETKLGRTIALTIAIALGLFVGWLTFKTHYFNMGYSTAIHAIAAQDQKAINERNKALETVKACRDSGRTWNVSLGLCG